MHFLEEQLDNQRKACEHFLNLWYKTNAELKQVQNELHTTHVSYSNVLHWNLRHQANQFNPPQQIFFEQTYNSWSANSLQTTQYSGQQIRSNNYGCDQYRNDRQYSSVSRAHLNSPHPNGTNNISRTTVSPVNVVNDSTTHSVNVSLSSDKKAPLTVTNKKS